MRDNLEELTDILNLELLNIKVSEELKLKTLEKCKRNKRTFFDKAFTPMTCTIAACLLMGVMIYPIYNKSSLMKNQQMIMNTSDKGIEALDKPSTDSAILSNEANIIEDKSSKVKPKEIIEQNKKEVNESSNEQNEMMVLNEDPTIAFRMKSSMESEQKDKGISSINKGIIATVNEGIIDNDKNTKDDSSIASSEEKQNDLEPNEEVKMKVLSVEEARRIFGDSINIPSYIPIGFVMDKILVPEVQNGSNQLYEIVYSNNSQYFIIAEYKNINNASELDTNTTLDSKVAEGNNMVININKIPVKYTLCESIDNNELPYAKLTWDNGGSKHSVEGSAPLAELINIISSIIR